MTYLDKVLDSLAWVPQICAFHKLAKGAGGCKNATPLSYHHSRRTHPGFDELYFDYDCIETVEVLRRSNGPVFTAKKGELNVVSIGDLKGAAIDFTSECGELASTNKARSSRTKSPCLLPPC